MGLEPAVWAGSGFPVLLTVPNALPWPAADRAKQKHGFAPLGIDLPRVITLPWPPQRNPGKAGRTPDRPLDAVHVMADQFERIAVPVAHRSNPALDRRQAGAAASHRAGPVASMISDDAMPTQQAMMLMISMSVMVSCRWLMGSRGQL